MEFGHFRESIILKDARRVDPDEELEKRLSLREGRGTEMADGGARGKRKREVKKDKEQWKGIGSEDQKGVRGPRGAEAAAGGAHKKSSEGAGLSAYNDIPSENGDTARSKEEDHFGFMYSVSEADRH